MSDDKREKLREYLRNNRPKNRVNLGNNSDNKENSNKNLKNESNLDNLNLNNSQISNNETNSNKNSNPSNSPNKRDYDKEPLIIYEYSSAINLFFGIIVLVVSVFFCFYLAYYKNHQQ
ncbi:hypothetical protein [Campylobacter ureolyticus]|uniref:Uncharacterized protein n=2 Tax=Campylobacter ureolyticus TaxID=827 RepID=A0AAE7JPN2_9BACT|nr:hypothetical protein [Campylobacter ureolyticus]QKF84521.1 hypothetical protein CURT_1040 [Campylobacter ureolyticus]QQY35321.1 hypothetical protein I6I59_07340 [Campylobacter ureolyticus]SUX22381.1 Uncharacterised protein [Campylobacter ureolyticus]